MQESEDPSPKIGSGHASAMARQGLRELRAAMYPESNVAQQTEYGLYGTRTPGEVAESRRADARDPDQEHESTLQQRVAEAETRETPEPNGKEMQKE